MDIIAHLGSGKGKGKKNFDAAKAVLDELNINYTLHVTESKGHAEQIAKTLCEEHSGDAPRTIVALGGDGTFHEVLNGIDFEKARLGFIPSGRGNDFAIGTGAASLDPKTAINDIIRNEPTELDYIQVDTRRCLNVGGTGLDVEVLLRTARSNNKLTYTASLFKCLLSFKPYPVKLTTDSGEVLELPCVMAGVCNGSQIGGGIRLAPIAKANDGKLEIIVMEKPKHTPTIFVMPGFVKGKHMNKPYTHHLTCESVTIQTEAPVQLDGEIYYDLNFEARVVKNGVKTFVPTINKK